MHGRLAPREPTAPARGAATLARAAAAGTGLRAARAGTAAAHGAESLAVLAAVATRLARGAETFGDTAAAARRVLVAQTGLLLLGHARVALRHDLALVDPDLDADPTGRGLRLDEAVVDVSADRVQWDAAFGVLPRPAQL